MAAKPVVLVFSGHDPSGAAGIQADIETLASVACHSVSVITSLTAQNTSVFKSMTPQSPARFREQLYLLTQDVTVEACKIGLIGSIELVEVIAEYLTSTNFPPHVPVVLDPVLGSGSGATLAPPELVEALTVQLFPHTSVVTPNLAEARQLTGRRELNDVLHALLDLGCETALVTAADRPGRQVTNTWMRATREIHHYHWDKLPGTYHGSGCTLSAALAGRLAHGEPLQPALEGAQEYTWMTLQHARRTGAEQLHPERFFAGPCSTPGRAGADPGK